MVNQSSKYATHSLHPSAQLKAQIHPSQIELEMQKSTGDGPGHHQVNGLQQQSYSRPQINNYFAAGKGDDGDDNPLDDSD
jgi:hypothetical protein